MAAFQDAHGDALPADARGKSYAQLSEKHKAEVDKIAGHIAEKEGIDLGGKAQKGKASPPAEGGSAQGTPEQTAAPCPAAEGEAPVTDGPEYDEQTWSRPPNDQQANCYAYAMNAKPGEGESCPWPGEKSGCKVKRPFSPGPITDAMLKDGGGDIMVAEQCPYQKKNNLPPPQKKGYYLVAMVTTAHDPNAKSGMAALSSDFHFYRQDADGGWSHKIGLSPSRVDANGLPIRNPQTCGRRYDREIPGLGRRVKEYTEFGGYFYVKKGGVRV